MRTKVWRRRCFAWAFCSGRPSWCDPTCWSLATRWARTIWGLTWRTAATAMCRWRKRWCAARSYDSTALAVWALCANKRLYGTLYGILKKEIIYSLSTFIWTPNALHAITVQRHSRQLTKRFAYVEVAQRRYLEADHFVALRIELRLFGGHLPLESQVKPIADQHFGHAGRMLYIRDKNISVP